MLYILFSGNACVLFSNEILNKAKDWGIVAQWDKESTTDWKVPGSLDAFSWL